MRTLFIGGTRRGYLAFRALVESGANVVGVISLAQSEHESERYEREIELLAHRLGIPHYLTRWLKDRDYAGLIGEELRPDIAFVVGCRILIPDRIYSIPPLGMLAVHDSLLPHYRGFAPLNWSIINGESQTGVTLFYLTEHMDGGDIVSQEAIPIGPHDTAPDVYERVCQATVNVILGAYPLLAQKLAPRLTQSYDEGDFTCSRTPGDGIIDWRNSTQFIYNQVRALTDPYPGAFSFYGDRQLTIWKAQPVENPPRYVGRIPGRVVAVSQCDGYVDVLTGDGVLRLLEVQIDGKEKTLPAKVIKSVRSSLGLSVIDLLRRIQQLEHTIAGLTEGLGP